MKKSWIIIILILLVILSYRVARGNFLYQGAATINIGLVLSGESKEESVFYQNSSPVVASFNPTLSGLDAPFFNVISNQCVNVASSQSCSVRVRFMARPNMQPRIYNAQLGSTLISAQFAQTPQASSTPLTMLLIEPMRVNFKIAPNRPQIQVFKITNRSGVTQTVDLSLIGPDSIYYSMTDNSCGTQLVPNSSCQITVRVTNVPLIVNEARNAHLSISGIKVDLFFQRGP